MAIIYVTPRTPGGINGGIAQAKAGDLILVKNGVYRSFFINKNNILIVADGKKVIIDGRLRPTPGEQAQMPAQVLAFVGVSDLQLSRTQQALLQGVEVRGFTVLYGSARFSNAQNCRIIHNGFIHSPENGVSLINCSGILIWSNGIFGAKGNGIDIDAASPSNWIVCNLIKKCTGDGIRINSSNNAVIDNTAKDNQGSGISANGKNNLIYKNRLKHNDIGPGPVDTGIIINDDENKLVSNEIRDDLSDGLILNGNSNYSGNDEIVGCKGNDVLVGGNYNVLEGDILEGGGGNSAILDGCYNTMTDCLVGGNGNDEIISNCPSNNFHDILYGGTGDDTLRP